MTTILDRPGTFPELRSGHPQPLPRRAGAALRDAWSLRWRGVAWLLPVLVIGAVVHAVGMGNFPRWVDDPGTYLSQAWSVVYEGRLSPYSYFYDHAPGGWIQIALWAMLTDGFDRYDSVMAFGNECMLIAKVVSIGLLYWLGRRLSLPRPAAAAAGLLLALNPLALAYTRWTFLDNLVTPWIILAFGLALSRKRSMIGAIGAGLAFAMAALTKETTLVLAPALLYALVQNSDRRTRAHVLVMSLGLSGLLMSTYVVYALSKGELFDGPGHNSLLGTAQWQLVNRESSGSVLDSTSAVHTAISQWLTYDSVLLLGGLAAGVLLLFVRRWRPVSLCLLLETFMVVRGGYVPAMQVINFLPWCALAIPGVVEVLRGNPELAPRFAPPRGGRLRAVLGLNRADADADTQPIPQVEPLRIDLFQAFDATGVPAMRTATLEPATVFIPAQARTAVPARRAARGQRRPTVAMVRTAIVLVLVAAATVQVAPQWGSKLAYMMTVQQPPELEDAVHWVADNVPRNNVLVVHDGIWTDLVQRYGFPTDNVIMAYKVDADPEVHNRLEHLDYLVVPDWYYTAQNGKYPTLIEGQKHAVAVAHFGSGPDAVTIWHVSSRWRP